MKAPWSGQLSAAKTGWLFALLFFGFLVFLFVPGPRDPESLPAATFVKPPPSRLVALGLSDNPDFEHLPEYFALYADKADWRNDKTIFAYWNPGSNSYSYFFEVVRTSRGYHFKELAEPKNVDGYWDEVPPEDVQIRFWRPWPVTEPLPLPSSIISDPAAEPKVRVDLDLKPSQILPPEVKVHLSDSSGKK